MLILARLCLRMDVGPLCWLLVVYATFSQAEVYQQFLA